MKKDDKFIRYIKDLVKTLVISLVLVILLTQFVFRPIRVEGSSMYPTLVENESGFSNIIGLKLGSIDRFDIVIVYVEEQDKYIVKRVIGLPGETVQFISDQLYIDGTAIDEPHLDNDLANQYRIASGYFTANTALFSLDEGEYFLMGDNRPRSSDSRQYGPFNIDQIKSKHVLIIYPLDRIRYLGK